MNLGLTNEPVPAGKALPQLCKTSGERQLEPSQTAAHKPQPPAITGFGAAIMVYRWEQHRLTCYRLYVEENRTIQEVVDYMRVHHDFTPR